MPVSFSVKTWKYKLMVFFQVCCRNPLKIEVCISQSLGQFSPVRIYGRVLLSCFPEYHLLMFPLSPVLCMWAAELDVCTLCFFSRACSPCMKTEAVVSKKGRYDPTGKERWKWTGEACAAQGREQLGSVRISEWHQVVGIGTGCFGGRGRLVSSINESWFTRFLNYLVGWIFLCTSVNSLRKYTLSVAREQCFCSKQAQWGFRW